jgi:hypothetical protein
MNMGMSEAASVDAIIAGIIERTVRERFGDNVIDRIAVKREVDLDGDIIMTVKVVLSEGTKLTDVKGDTLSGLVRHIRTNLSAVQEFTFPVVRMMSKKDAEIIRDNM